MTLILKRAAELQEGADGRGTQRTLAEIQAIAAEVGIDAPFVSEAVAVAAGSLGIGLLAALGGIAIAINVTDNALVASAIVAASAIAGTAVSARALWFSVAERWRRGTQSIVAALAERAIQLGGSDQRPEKLLESPSNDVS